jgi:aminoglycoside phosphotransferase (APT) family kinase protein
MAEAAHRSFEAPVQQTGRDLQLTADVVGRWLGARLDRPDLRVVDVSAPAGTGVANETLLLDAEWTEAGRPCSGGFVLRVAVPDPLYRGADIAVHHDVYASLSDVADVPVPRVYGYEADRTLLGAQFFVMERIAGEVPADNPYYTESGFVVAASVEQRRMMWDDAVGVMARFHQVDPERLGFLRRPQRGVSGLEQDLDYWRSYHEWAARGRPHPTLDAASRWLLVNLPADPPTTPAWGDARICNMIFRDFRCVSMLDWDGVSLAGPESDLAWWIVMEHNGGRRAPLAGLGTFDELVQTWEQLSGWRVQNLRYHVAYACFRLGGILRKLNDQMLASGWLPEGTDIATNSEVVQMLSLLLDLPPAGEISVTVPPVSALG